MTPAVIVKLFAGAAEPCAKAGKLAEHMHKKMAFFANLELFFTLLLPVSLTSLGRTISALQVKREAIALHNGSSSGVCADTTHHTHHILELFG